MTTERNSIGQFSSSAKKTEMMRLTTKEKAMVKTIRESVKNKYNIFAICPNCGKFTPLAASEDGHGHPQFTEEEIKLYCGC